MKLWLGLKQAKLFKIELLALSESTLTFWKARAKLLIALTLCWSSVDQDRRVTSVKTISYHRWVLIGS